MAGVEPPSPCTVSWQDPALTSSDSSPVLAEAASDARWTTTEFGLLLHGSLGIVGTSGAAL